MASAHERRVYQFGQHKARLMAVAFTRQVLIGRAWDVETVTPLERQRRQVAALTREARS